MPYTKTKTQCPFCAQSHARLEWKNTEVLRRFISLAYKIKPRAKTGLCAKHQRQVAKAVKRARAMGLLAATPE